MARITFIGNCQTRVLSQLYDRFVAAHTGDSIAYVESYNDLSAPGRQAIQQADILVEQVLDLRPRADGASVSTAARRVLVPLVSCGFLWPYAGEPHPHNEPTWFRPLGPYPGEISDSYLNRLLLKGVSPEDAAVMYLELDINSVRNLDRLYELVMDRQRRRDELCGFHIADQIASHVRTEAVFLSPHHPNLRISLALAEQFFHHMGAERGALQDLRAQLRRAPFPPEMLPIHPNVARHFGLTYADETARFRYGIDATVTFREFVLRYMRGEWNPDLEEGIALAASDPAAALVKLAAGLVRSPEAAEGYRARAEALLRTGALPDAEEALRHALRLAPDDPRSHHTSAVVLHRLGRWAGSAAAARQAIELDPGNPHCHAALANAAMGAGDLDAAERAARQAVMLEPGNGHLHHMLAHILDRRGEISAAIECLRRAIALIPESAGFRNHLSHLLFRQNEVQEAVSQARVAATLDPRDVSIRLHLYHALSRAGHADEAESALRTAIGLQPENGHLHEQLGHALVRAGRAEEALAAFREAIRLAPDNASIRSSASHGLHRGGHTTEAIREVLAAIALRPEVPHDHAHLGNMLRDHAGDIPGAISAYERAVELAPDNAGFAAELAKLRAAIAARRQQNALPPVFVPSSHEAGPG